MKRERPNRSFTRRVLHGEFNGANWTLVLSCSHIAVRRYEQGKWKALKSTRCFACWKRRPTKPYEHAIFELTDLRLRGASFERAGGDPALGDLLDLPEDWNDPRQEPRDG